MRLKLYQIDAFANKTFEGNPAAIVPLKKWLSDKKLQQIATENNLSETAYFVKNGKSFQLRWFTPDGEVDMCGHATLASAYVLFNELGFKEKEITFNTKSGKLYVKKQKEFYCMDFPAQEIKEVKVSKKIEKALGVKPIKLFKSIDYIAIYKNEKTVASIVPDFTLLKTLDLRGVIITSTSKKYDFVSRFFAPKYAIDEDPVTGSAHTQLVPYYAQELNKKKMLAKQISKRGGELYCELKKDRFIIKGQAIKYLEGEISI